MENLTVNEGKTMAIISYITVIGTLIAFIMNINKKNSFAAFHIRQMIGIIALSFLLNLARRYMGLGFFGNLMMMLPIVLWVIGFIGAIQGEEKTVPLLGDQFQEWFKGIG